MSAGRQEEEGAAVGNSVASGLHLATELVSSDWESSLRGSRPPRPLTAPIFAASTYRLASAKEGEELSCSLAKVDLNNS